MTTSVAAKYIGTPFGKYWGTPGREADVQAMQAKGYSGADKYWTKYSPRSAQLTGGYYYDTEREEADRVKYDIAQSGGGSGKSGGSKSGYPTTTTTLKSTSGQSTLGQSTSEKNIFQESSEQYIPSGPKPTMGEMAEFEIPERPVTPEFGTVEMGEIPEFVAPEWDERAISALTQKRSAPGLRRLRTAVQESMARNFDNPNVRRMTLRDALEGYGTGIEGVLSGAGQAATAEYAQKYANEYKAAGMNWQAAVQTVRDKYAGQMESRKMEYQAELDAVNQVYATAVQAETQRVQALNQRVSTIYQAAMDAYLKLGITKKTGIQTETGFETQIQTETGFETQTQTETGPTTTKYAYLNA